MKNNHILLRFIFIIFSGCVSEERIGIQTSDRDIALINIFEQLISDKMYYEAFLRWESVKTAYERVDGDMHASAHFLNMLLNRTAASGQEDWIYIFMEEQIPLEVKQALLLEIHETPSPD